jgi:hypothetical protein
VDKVGFCLFLTKKLENAGCIWLSLKPAVLGAFTFGVNFQTGKVEWYLKTTEICALAGILRENPDLLRSHFEVARMELAESNLQSCW